MTTPSGVKRSTDRVAAEHLRSLHRLFNKCANTTGPEYTEARNALFTRLSEIPETLALTLEPSEKLDSAVAVLREIAKATAARTTQNPARDWLREHGEQV